jgi:uroporphyrinogen-III decarboxylase
VTPSAVGYYPTRSKGISNKDAMQHLETTLEILVETTIRHGWDTGACPSGMLLPVKPLELLGIKQIKWPGGGLSDDQPYKWVEAEYMRQDEYDELMTSPVELVTKKIWPRISTTLSPIGELLSLPPSAFLPGASAVGLSIFLGEVFSPEPTVKLLKNILALVEEHKRFKELSDCHTAQLVKAGYPKHSDYGIQPAFDWLSINLRGLRGILVDMYQAPDKLTAALEMITREAINGVVEASGRTDPGGPGRVVINMERGAIEYLSEEQFREFYWPSFKSLLLGLIEAGFTPIPIFVGDYTPALELLSELPPGKVVGHFDKIDRKKAKQLIGDVMCFWGNVPARLLCEGTVEEVKRDVKELIDTFGDNGGLIIDGALGIPDNARPENVQAMTDAVLEYGVW